MHLAGHGCQRRHPGPEIPPLSAVGSRKLKASYDISGPVVIALRRRGIVGRYRLEDVPLRPALREGMRRLMLLGRAHAQHYGNQDFRANARRSRRRAPPPAQHRCSDSEADAGLYASWGRPTAVAIRSSGATAEARPFQLLHPEADGQETTPTKTLVAAATLFF